MRATGLDPMTCTWLLNDLDAIAVALGGVNAFVHGLGPNVILRRGNGLEV